MTAPPQPAAPAPRDAGVGERVSVDRAALEALRACAAAYVKIPAGRDDFNEACDLASAVASLGATARPLAPAPGAVGAATLAEWDDLIATIQRRRTADAAHLALADALRAAVVALTAAPPTDDGGALAEALDAVGAPGTARHAHYRGGDDGGAAMAEAVDDLGYYREALRRTEHDRDAARDERDAAIARADFSDRAAEAYARVARLAAPPTPCAHEPYDPIVAGIASTCRHCGAIYVADVPA